MAENIKNYGGIEGNDSESAQKTNVTAIHEASVAAADNTVYLPAGDWFIGAPDIVTGDALIPGSDVHDRGAAGLGFVGDGADQSFLKLGHVSDDQANGIRYVSDNPHSNVVWDGITYDGRYDAFNFDASSGTAHWGLRIKGDGDFTFKNTRFTKWAGNAVYGGWVDASYAFDSCTFHDSGMKVAEDSGGTSVSHHIVLHLRNSYRLDVTNSEFETVSGSVMDVDGDGQVAVNNCWARGVGNGFFKIDGMDTIDISNVYFESETQEMIDRLSGGDVDQSSGPFIYRLDKSGQPQITLNDVEARDIGSAPLSVSNGAGMDVLGGYDGPVAFHNCAFRLFSSAIRAMDSTPLNFDMGDLSVHGVDGDIFVNSDLDGSIDRLHWDNADSLGDSGGISIGTNNEGGSVFSPTVPSQSDVGVNSTSTDGSASISWVTPTDSDVLTGTVTLQLAASDSEDSDDSLTVEYKLDGGSWVGASYNSNTGYYEDSFDSTTLSTGTHTFESRVTDSAGNTSSAVIGVLVGELFADWTPRWDSTADDWGLAGSSTFDGDHALAFEASGTDRTRYAISNDPIGEPADVEVLDKFRVPAFAGDSSYGYHARVNLRSGTQSGAENGYWIEVEKPEGAFRLGKYTNGGVTTLKRFGTPAENTFFYRRFRVEGTTLKAKIWQADQSEPAEWDVTLSDSDHADGWVGLGSFDPELVETDVFSVATGGGTASFVTSDSNPSVAWTTPTDSSTVSEGVTVEVDANDSEDSSGSLTVEYHVDNDSWVGASYNTDTGYYDDTWDTTALADGNHVLEARAVDSAGNVSKTSITVAVDNADTPTVDSLSLSEVETDNSDAEFDAAWQVSDANGDLDSIDLSLTQDSDGSTEDTTTVAISGDSATGTTRLVASGDDGSSESYTVEAVVADAAGQTATGTVSATEAESNSSAPEINRFSVSEAGSPNPHAEITVVWDVSDVDGDLSSVEIDVSDSNGTVQSATWSVSGKTASDTDSFKIKNVDGQTFDVTITVTDEQGYSASATSSVTE